MTHTETHDTFEEFKNAFSYGSRSDLTFKFLKSFTPDEAADYLQELMRLAGELIVNGNIQPVHDHIFIGQKKAYSRVTNYTYDDGPFAPMGKPLAESRLALLTSSGHFVAGSDPEPFGVKNMTQEESVARIKEFVRSEPELSTIPVDTPSDQLRVRHGGYDIRYAQADNEVNLPLRAVKSAAESGLIGQLHPEAFSFVGACSQKRLLNRTLPKWVRFFKEKAIDALLLVPV